MVATSVGGLVGRSVGRTGAPARGSAVGLGGDPQIGLERLPALGELRLGVIVAHGGNDDHVLTVGPVDRGGDRVVGRELQGVEHTDDLVDIAARSKPGRSA